MSRTSPSQFVPEWVRRKTEWLPLSGSERALWYVDGVLGKSLPTCLRVEQACQRFKDLKDYHMWEPERVDEVVSKIEMMPTPEGTDHGNFTVLPWQALLTAVAHGLVTPGGDRAVREMLLTIPRKAGKSAFAGALFLRELIAPFGGGKSPHMALVGVNEKTATHTFNKMTGILVQSEIVHGKRNSVAGQNAIKYTKKEIHCGKNNGRATMETMGAKALDGYTLTGFVVDEVANIKDRSGLETLRSGMGHARNPLIFLTTTPADLPISAFDDELDEALKVLEGESDRPSYFPLIYRAEANELEQAGDHKLWERVQPSLGWSVRLGHYVDEWKRMQGSDDTRHKFYTRYLCAPSTLSGIWVSPDQWLSTEDPREAPVRDDPQTRWLIGIDLSDSRDTTAICILAYNDRDDTAEVWFEVHAPQGAIPAGEQSGRRAAQLRDWASEGWLTIHPGKVLDHQKIADRLTELAQELRPLGIYGDNFIAINEVAFRSPPHIRPLYQKKNKTAMSMAEPMDLFVRMVEGGYMKMQKHPVAVQHLKNTNIVINKQGGRITEKFAPNSSDKIDCTDALLMALFGYANSKDDKLIGTDEAPIMSTGSLPGTAEEEDANPVLLGD